MMILKNFLYKNLIKYRYHNRNFYLQNDITITIPSSKTIKDEKMKDDHHVKKSKLTIQKFKNPWSTEQTITIKNITLLFKEAIFKGFQNRAKLTNKDNPTSEDLKKAFPLSKINWNEFCKNDNYIKCLWVGHAICLLKMDNIYFLTDPVFSDRCSPTQYLGPKRFVAPSFSLDDPEMPKIDFVIISHNHYDHLDYESVMKLYKRFGNDLTWYVPLCLKKWFLNIKINNVIELDWYSCINHLNSNLELIFTPTQHWTNRYGFIDAMQTLWGSWLVKNQETNEKIWFGGDTGYCPVFKEIGNKYGPIDLALIPIGAYEPRFLLKFQHVNPEEAVEIHKDIKSKISMAIHCCTFSMLSFEALDEPPLKLKQIQVLLN